MKTLLNKTFFAIVTLLSIFIIGTTPVMIISSFISITTDETLQSCITTVPFIIFNIIGIVISTIYINQNIIEKL